MPTRRPIRTGLRLAFAMPLAAPCRPVASLLVPAGARPPAGAMTPEASAVTATALAVAATLIRHRALAEPGTVTAALLLAAIPLVCLLPGGWAPLVPPSDPHRTTAHHHWRSS